MRYWYLFLAIFCLITRLCLAIDEAKDHMRNSQYNSISKHLEALSNKDLLTLLKQGTPLQTGYGSTIKLEIAGTSVFVKQIPLNEIEGLPQNISKTENLFELPPYYQYGVGSGGFSVWREVAAHQLSTEWVLKGESQNFPLMYHWRILENFQEKKTFDLDEFNKYVAYWENSSAIGQRTKANHQASRNVVIFIEYIPETLKSWLSKETQKGNAALDKAIMMVEKNLQETSRFLINKEMLHFDAHFQNILTDGERLYFSDFGLAMRKQFALSQEELQFFETHALFDQYYVATKITNWIVGNAFGKENIDKILQIYADKKTPISLPHSFTPYQASVVKRYAPLALTMNTFFDSLIKHTKMTVFPANALEHIWAEISEQPISFISNNINSNDTIYSDKTIHMFNKKVNKKYIDFLK